MYSKKGEKPFIKEKEGDTRSDGAAPDVHPLQKRGDRREEEGKRHCTKRNSRYKSLEIRFPSQSVEGVTRSCVLSFASRALPLREWFLEHSLMTFYFFYISKYKKFGESGGMIHIFCFKKIVPEFNGRKQLPSLQLELRTEKKGV